MTARILIVLVLVLATVSNTFGAEPNGLPGPRSLVVLRDGFLFDGVEGTVFRQKGEGGWFFAAGTDLSDDIVVLKAGTAVELLPSSALEKISAYVEAKTAAGQITGIRLIARVTKYNAENFLFPVDFIAMSAVDEPWVTEQPEDAGKIDGEPNEPSIIPTAIRKRLELRRVVSFEQLKETEDDVILSDRTGFVVAGEKHDLFTIDGLGRKVEDFSFRLLPCEVLERTDRQMAETPGRQRYRIAGVVTRYEENYYLLLQRAVRTYHHGNFAR